MKKLDLNKFSVEQLELIKDTLIESQDINEAIKKVDSVIKHKTDYNNLNVKLTVEMMEKYNFFPPHIIEVIKMNGIKNLEELYSADIGSFKDITQSIREHLEWGQEFFYYKVDTQSEDKPTKLR